MAAKKPAKPRKFKQARKDAKSAAKQTFSGKSQARLKDPMTKLTADDKAALSEMKATAKAELGKNAYLSKKDYEATRRDAIEKFRSEMRAEFGEYGGKKAGATDTQAPKRTPKAKTATKPTVSENAKRLSKTRTFVTAVETPSQTEKKKTVKKAEVKKTTAKKAVKPKKTMGQISKSVTEATKPKVNKPATKGYAAGKTLNATGQARYDELIKQGVKPKSAMNKALFAQEKAAKPAAKKPATNTGGMTDRQQAALERKVNKTERKAAKLRAADPAKYDAREKAATDPKLTSEQKVKKIREIGSTTKPKPAATPKSNKYLDMQAAKRAKTPSKEVATRPKFVTSTRTNAPQEIKGNSIAAKAKRFGKTKAAGKGLIAGALISEIGSAVKGSTEKDFREIQRLENRLAKMQGKAPKYKNMGSNKNVIESSKADLSNLANLATMGLVGKTRRGRMDELNAKIAKAEGKRAERINAGRAAKAAAGKKTLGGANRSSTPMNKTFKIATGAGGSTSATPIKGSGYRVAKGDTLSGIAKRSGVTLSEILAANPRIADKKSKYKGGSMIWANTKVNIPTSKKK